MSSHWARVNIHTLVVFVLFRGQSWREQTAVESLAKKHQSSHCEKEESERDLEGKK